MKMNCIAVDDELLALKKIERFAEKIDYLNLLGTFDNALSTFSFLRENKVDLIFLDIQMDEFTGIQLLETLKDPPYVILTTAFDEYALKAYELDVIDYLLKPIPFERFVKATEKVYARFLKDQNNLAPAPTQHQPENNDHPEYTFIKSGNKTVKVYFDKILYIEGQRDYLQIHTEDSRIMTLLNFKKMQELLDDQKFIRVHKSYIISIDKIDYIENNTIKIKDKLIPVSSTYKIAFNNLLQRKNFL
ncbi:two component transcriptional regulator, LytTR family [Draconibacterium orientale]|uniref:Two component transcriptional regulator, LytTR family n=2 Tax=Draconibacterium orientale TaxID=1168034 RepID=A0A1I0EEK0_9BACT|nr:LytTR family DNA-binding domain-containing protein [Draconibacterium orientale]SET43656.1 two component transcriptional regulator, LytTR family [Draconibacterium orientale]